MSAFKRLICVLLAAAALCSTLASCSGGHGVVSDDASDTSVFESESPSEHPSPSGDTSGVIDLPWEIPEDIENPSQGLEMAESYSKEYGDCYVVVGIGTCENENIIIPSTINGLPVVEIAENAFLRNNKIKSVYCGNRVTKIGNAAFNRCSNLKKAIIPASVEIIEEEAFSWCGLTELEIGDRVNTMGRGVFQMNTSLRSVKLPFSLTIIPESAFNSCSALADVELPPNVVYINDRAFAYTALKSIRLPASVESINAAAFNKSQLQSFEVDEENPYLCSVDGVLYSKDMSTLIAYPQNRGNYTVPDGVKMIDDGAFLRIANTSFEVSLPDSIRTLSSESFTIEYSGNLTVNIKKGLSYLDSFCFSCPNGCVKISFEGTKEEWAAIRKAEYWYAPYEGFGSQSTTVKCSDGILTFNYDPGY